MSVNVVNQLTGELSKVAGNPSHVTDSVTDGDMRSVTSNAVADAMKTEVVNVGTVTAASGETANLVIRRAGKVVQLRLSSLTTTGDPHDVVFSGVIPEGYRPSIDTIVYGKYVGYATKTDAGGTITTNGSISTYSYSQFNNGTILATYITA